MIETWQELLNNNSSTRPIAVGGWPRGGTTYAYRNLCNYIDGWQLEEYFHLYYEFRTLESGEIIIDKPAIDVKKRAPWQYHINKNGSNEHRVATCLKRYHAVRDTNPWNRVFIKVLPLHARDIYQGDPRAFRDLCSSHHWIFVLRRDYINMTLSNLYSNHFNHFHYYDDTPLRRGKIVGSLDELNTVYKNTWEWLKHMYTASGGEAQFVYAEDFAESLAEPTLRFTHAPLPRFDRDKPQLFREVFQNYDELVEHMQKVFKQVEQETDGFFTFTDKEVEVNT